MSPIITGASATVASTLGGYEIGYDQITSPVTVSSSTESSGTTVITCAAHTFDGAAVLLTWFCPSVIPASSDEVIVSLFESTTQISRLADNRAGGAVTPEFGVTACYRFTPSAGSHTYTITAFRGSTNGTIEAGAGGTGAYPPCFARFTKV